MTTTDQELHVATREAVLGHLALHYMPGDERKARRLLELLGCTLVDNGPDGFCTVLVNGGDANYADNVMFLSAVTSEQAAVENALREKLSIGKSPEDPAISGYRTSMTASPESVSHVGLRFKNLEDLEQTLLDLEAAAAPGGELEGRIHLVKYLPRAGDDAAASAAVANQLTSSPAFSGEEMPSFAPYWIQSFVTTDLCGFGILAFGNTFELDYVFGPFFQRPPSFGRRPNGQQP